MIEPTDDEKKKKLDEICIIFDEAMDTAVAFYDCRLILSVMLGRAGAFAAGLRQAKIIDERGTVRFFMAGLENAFIDGKVPIIAALDNAETKQ